MAIKLGVHVRCENGDKGYISAIFGDACEVTLQDGSTGTVAADSLKTLKGRPRKIVAAVPVEAPMADESGESASV